MEKNLGTGIDDGAGEAWKVGPAYAALEGVIRLELFWPEVETGRARCDWGISEVDLLFGTAVEAALSPFGR